MNETPRSNILAYDLTTGNLITSWAPALNAQGMEIKASTDGSTIYVGGDFDQVNGQWRSRIAALDAQTGALLPWNPGANSRVDAIAVDERTPSTTAGTSPRSATRPSASRRGLGSPRPNAVTGALLPWNPTADKIVFSMVYHPGTGRVIVAGTFNTLNGANAARHGLARRRHGRAAAVGREHRDRQPRRRMRRSDRSRPTARRSSASGGPTSAVAAPRTSRARSPRIRRPASWIGSTAVAATTTTSRSPVTSCTWSGTRTTGACSTSTRSTTRSKFQRAAGDRQAPLADVDQRVRNLGHLGLRRDAGRATVALAADADRRHLHRSGAGCVERRQQRRLHRPRRRVPARQRRQPVRPRALREAGDLADRSTPSRTTPSSRRR